MQLLRADLQKNPANIKQTDITFRFTDGISESEHVNELFVWNENGGLLKIE